MAQIQQLENLPFIEYGTLTVDPVNNQHVYFKLNDSKTYLIELSEEGYAERVTRSFPTNSPYKRFRQGVSDAFKISTCARLKHIYRRQNVRDFASFCDSSRLRSIAPKVTQSVKENYRLVQKTLAESPVNGFGFRHLKSEHSDYYIAEDPTQESYCVPKKPIKDSVSGRSKEVCALSKELVALKTREEKYNFVAKVYRNRQALVKKAEESPAVCKSQIVSPSMVICENGGKDLHESLLKSYRRLTPSVFKNVCEFVAQQHSNNIILGDIKSENCVKKGVGEQVRLIDLDDMRPLTAAPLSLDLGTETLLTDNLFTKLVEGEKQAYFNADNYALLLTMMECSSFSIRHELDPNFLRVRPQVSVCNSRNTSSFSNWINKNILEPYRPAVIEFIKNPSVHTLPKSIFELMDWDNCQVTY
ncbi:hypothetical protein D5018_00675 [Parashewanella curva]|uniref:Protein kinase domain-containing protein n=1 Tax=Parashewanella curva TaxID=2338552 RepID=A0A3L8Q239_9GAMM|nr:hypothetical protein [Parashewanella curva]RLV61665.1 hypothetical protein D5018_00675 [Parashewanella curva]